MLGLKLFNDPLSRLFAKMHYISYVSCGGGDNTVCLHSTVSVRSEDKTILRTEQGLAGLVTSAFTTEALISLGL